MYLHDPFRLWVAVHMTGLPTGQFFVQQLFYPTTSKVISNVSFSLKKLLSHIARKTSPLQKSTCSRNRACPMALQTDSNEFICRAPVLPGEEVVRTSPRDRWQQRPLGTPPTGLSLVSGLPGWGTQGPAGWLRGRRGENPSPALPGSETKEKVSLRVRTPSLWKLLASLPGSGQPFWPENEMFSSGHIPAVPTPPAPPVTSYSPQDSGCKSNERTCPDDSGFHCEFF